MAFRLRDLRPPRAGEGLLTSRRLKAFAKAVRPESVGFAARCSRALRGLEGSAAPAELLAPSARMLARGVLTDRLLSVGRDRPWPYAFTRQLDPDDPGFVPRSLLPVLLNVNYRDWTTLGLPGRPDEAIVDPAGWLTPFRDGPSIAVWVGDSRSLFTLGPLPGWGSDDVTELRQERLLDAPVVRTTTRRGDVQVRLDTFPVVVDGRLAFAVTVRLRMLASAPRPVRVGFAIRPSNPEGVAPLFDLSRRESGWWIADGKPLMFLPNRGDEVHLSTWAGGDVYGRVGGVTRDARPRPAVNPGLTQVTCPVGQAHGVELYRVNLSRGETFKRTAYCSMDETIGEVIRRSSTTQLTVGMKADWEGHLRAGARMELPVHDQLLRSCRATLLALCDGKEITSGPATYHSFWYRDAAYMLAALNRLGFRRRSSEVLRSYPSRQARSGAWLSQGGEWDGSGAAIWALMDHVRLSGDRELLRQVWPAMLKAARWIIATRQDGMMPPGWSAEHLGPADRYWWDAIWSCAGLREAALAARMLGHREEERELMLDHGTWLDVLRSRLGPGPVGAAPGRRLDSAAVSVLAAAWPLRLMASAEEPMTRTARWLLEHCMVEGGLFHDVGHAGVNPVLTCWLAQVRVAWGDAGAVQHLDYLAEHARGTGSWPEAFHPLRGGVMGDGDHGWAAAEVAMLLRNMVVLEDGSTLHLFRATDRRWFTGETLLEGVPTRFGPVDLRSGGGRVQLSGRWREKPRRIVWHKPEGLEGRLVFDGVEHRTDGPTLELD